MNNIGNVYLQMNNYDKAFNFYNKALLINEEFGNEKWKATNLSNLGNLYVKKLNYEKALEYYHESLSLREKINDRQGIGSTLMNIAIAYEGLKEFKESN